ncbi:hypothetical protein KUL72_02360 [Bradyrhizobium arachidis]|uniref:hypothetical protein n=1 Tax=Bradyrhizobium TaxID=374 RepID=UPI002161FF21|nr:MULTISPECIES: hypothetical protein [Bradyrhizobium]MDN4986615.1 hypothetical protein [Bradyrhizobium sp. WYCCWR 13022]UVO37267.1 hypothetical protein KUL72_02360 [Bradyrhizobium arachidis]
MGALWAALTWLFNNVPTIANYGWAAVVLAGIGATCLIALVCSAVLVALRYFNPISRHLSPFDSYAYSHDPAAGAPSREVYFSLVDFVIQHLWPACDRQIDLQRAIIREYEGDALLKDLAIEGMQFDARPTAQAFWIQYQNMMQGIEGSEPTLGFDALVDCINRLANGAYKSFCEQSVEMAKGVTVNDLGTHERLGPIWWEWAERHNRLVDEHTKVRQNPRFGRKLYRPSQPANWGDKVQM